MDTDQFRKKETEQHLKKILRGAFAGPPTPLKDIPKKSGESRVRRAGQKRRKNDRPKRKI
jgi:hypothetical protein